MDESRTWRPIHGIGIGAAAIMVAAAAAFALRGGPVGTPSARSGEATHAEDPIVDAGPEAAVRMVDRLQRLRGGAGVRRIELTGAELTALLRHAVPGMIPDGVHDPVVQLEGEEVRVRARISPAELRGGEALGEVLSVLPDDVEVELRGTVRRANPSEIEYRVEYASVGGIRLPAGVVAALVRSWPGGVGEPDAGEPALRAPWSVRDGSVEVSAGMLVVERPEPILVQSVDGDDGV